MSAITELLNILTGADEEIKQLKDANATWKRRDDWFKARVKELEETIERIQRQNYDLKQTVDNMRGVNNELVRRLENLGTGTINDAEEHRVGVTDDAKEPESEVRDHEDEALNMPLAAWADLETKTYNALVQANYQTCRDVCQSRASELLKNVRKFGVHCLNDLNYYMLLSSRQFVPEETQKKQQKIDKILLPSRARATKLENLGLTVRTYSELRAEGTETVADIIFDRYDNRRSKPQVLEQFKNSGSIKEFLARIDELGFMI